MNNWPRVTLLLLLCQLAGCYWDKPTLYLDREWSIYYAKNTCYLTLPLADRDPGLQPCLERQVHALEEFERALPLQFAANPDCANVVLVNFSGAETPPPATKFWRLLIDTEQSAAMRQPWDLMSPKSPQVLHGSGDPREVAEGVCAIVSGRGLRHLDSPVVFATGESVG